MKCSKQTSRAFTLIEMMTVLAIISILASLSVLAVRSNFAGLTAAGDKVTALFEFARQEAIAKNTLTAVVLVTSPSTQGNIAYRTFGVYELAVPSDGTAPVSSDWVQSAKWQTLPDGMAVDNTGGVTGVSSFISSATITPSLPALNCQGQQLNPATDYVVQIFMPSGRLLPPSSGNCTLKLVEGFYPPSSSTIVYQHKNSSAQPSNYVSYIFSTATGEPKVIRP